MRRPIIAPRGVAARSFHLRLAVIAALLVGAFSAGCAQDVGLIDRVQPGALDKKLLEGEWHLTRTVVDVPYHVGYTFVGETEELERVRFVLRQDQLVAYRSYDFIAGTDLAHAATGNPGKSVQGTPVAAWPVIRHFDIIRSYNAQTGEQTNVLEENDSDLPWYERRFVRINWGTNLIKGFAFTVDGIDTEPADSVVNDPSDPDAFTLAWRDAAKASGWTETRDPAAQREIDDATYIDFVTKVIAKPVAWSFWDADWGPERYPACWFFLNEDCKAAEIEVRTSLLKVDPAEDAAYAPLLYPDNAVIRDKDGAAIHVYEASEIVQENGTEVAKTLGLVRDPDGYKVRLPWFDHFGYFRTERYGYDEKYGEVESARQQLINRFPIWQADRTADGAMIPWAERKVRPIVYYLTPGFPAKLHAVAEDVANGWNSAFEATVAARQGKDASAVPRVFELRDNTLTINAKGEVTDRGQRVGDLRYSLISLIDEPTRAGLLGYGPSWADPLTGRVINGAAHMYGGPLRRFATTGRDLIRLVRGEIDPEEYGLGGAVAEEVIASLLGEAAVAADHAGNPGGAAGKSGGSGSGKKAAAGAKGSAAGAGFAGGGSKGKRAAAPSREERVQSAQAFAHSHINKAQKKNVHEMRKTKLKSSGNWASARLALAEGHAIEAMMTTREAVLGFGSPADQAMMASTPPGTPLPALDDLTRSRISPARWAGVGNRVASLDRERLLRKHNMMHAAFVDDAVLGIAAQLKDLDPDVAYEKIYAAVFRSTAEHEVGHTLGLRHNFEASTDALNWHKDYWALRGDTGKPLDEPTAAQINAGMDDFRYSSIMEYAGRFHADLKGLGRYDYAAIAFGYGELVEVWGDKAKAALQVHPMTRVLQEESRYLAGGDARLTDPRTIVDAALRGFVHYTAIPKMVGGVANLEDRKLVPLEDVVAEMSAVGGTEAAPRKRTLWPVPYRFCSDEYEMGTKTCHVYDDGADPWEIVRSGKRRWENHYVLDAFRRDRVDFFLEDYAGRAWFRYMHPVLIQYQHWLFDLYDPDDFFNPGAMWYWLADYRADDAGIVEGEWEKDPQGGLAATEAVRRGIAWLSAVVSTPEPGSYCLDKAKNSYTFLSRNTDVEICKTPAGCGANAACADMVVPFGIGRYQWTEYDDDTGYYFYERLRHAGAFYDKITALEVLADPETWFIGVDASQPLNNYILAMFIYFPKEITRIFGGVAAGRADIVGWKVGDGATLLPPDPFAESAATAKLPSIEMPGLYTLRPYAMFFGLAWLNAGWDQTFHDTMKVWLEGAGEAITLPAEATVATFVHPINSRIYKAAQSGYPGWFSAGYEMVAEAEKLGVAYKASGGELSTKWDLEDATTFLELARGMYDVFGLAWF